MITKTITNFDAKLNRDRAGSIDSGLSRYKFTWGCDSFTRRKILQFYEVPVQIDPGASVITDNIVKMLGRIESGISYVYGIGYTGRLYKITVSTDTPVLVTATSLNLKYGGSMLFFTGSTEKIYIGNDAGVSKMAFDGTGQTAITAGVSWIANVPRPGVMFLGATYWGNDTNIVKIDTTEGVTNATVLTPSVPANYHITDLSVTPDGAYMKIMASRKPVSDIQTIDPVDIGTNVETTVFYWNGTDTGYTSFETYPSFTGIGLYTMGKSSYITGYDFIGGMIRDETQKLFSMNYTKAATSATMDSTGDILFLASPEFDPTTSTFKTAIMAYGSLDKDTEPALRRLYRLGAGGSNTDVITVGAFKIVTNLLYPTSVAGGTTLTTSRCYFSTYEIGGGGSATARFYKFTLTPPSGSGTSSGGVYQSQTEDLPKRMKPVNFRIYCEPTVANNSIQVDLINTDDTVIPGTTKTYTFAAGTDITLAQGALEMIQVQFASKPVLAIAIRLTNKGSVNMIIHKVELDLDEWGY